MNTVSIISWEVFFSELLLPASSFSLLVELPTDKKSPSSLRVIPQLPLSENTSLSPTTRTLPSLPTPHSRPTSTGTRRFTLARMAQDPRVLLQKADKAAAGASSGFSLFGGKTEKWEAAADQYISAANAFRIQKQNREAGQCFEKAASIQSTKLSEPDDMANTLTEAFKVYKKESPEDAARVLQTAIAHYTSKGNFRRAATHQQNLAETYEVELGNQQKALQAYNTAAEWYESDNAEALANKLYLKVADLAALEGDYQTAITKFEAVAKSSLNNNLMKWSVKDYFLKAGICHLASQDLVATTRSLDMYRELDPSFGGTRENMLLTDLVAAVREGDQEVFADKLFQYDQLSKLDKWKTTLLLRVKGAIEKDEEDFS